MVTSLPAPGSPLFQLPATLHLPVPPFQLSGVPGPCTGGPSGPPPCNSIKFSTPPDTLLPMSARLPFWSDRSPQSPERSRSRSDFLVAAKLVVTIRTAHRRRTKRREDIICLSSVPGGTLVIALKGTTFGQRQQNPARGTDRWADFAQDWRTKHPHVLGQSPCSFRCKTLSF